MNKILTAAFILTLVISVLSCDTSPSSPTSNPKPEAKKVLLTILARNKEHTLPKFLECIENQTYNKKLITIYINTNNNADKTKEILTAWVEANKDKYHEIEFESHDVQLKSQSTAPHVWTTERFRTLGNIRNQSLKKTLEHQCDFYFVVDCDNFITPRTLEHLVEKDKPIIAPMLQSIPETDNPYSNFFYDVTEDGYYEDHAEYFPIRNREKLGTFKVPVVHCAYLIKSEFIDKLNYIDDTTDYEFVIFSRKARENGVDQYICNELEFGSQLCFTKSKISLEEEREKFLEYLQEHHGDVLTPHAL